MDKWSHGRNVGEQILSEIRVIDRGGSKYGANTCHSKNSFEKNMFFKVLCKSR